MIYLDNAATTFPKPQNVARSVIEAVKTYGGNPGRSGHSISMRTSGKIYQVRELVGDFFGVSAEQVVFASNCSHALNMAIKGVMSSGGHVITSTLEHNSVMRPLYALKKKGIIDYDCAPVYEGDVEKTLRSFAALIRPNTKAIVCTHASNVTGLILPIKELGDLCHQAGIKLIVDGAQSAGVLPVNLPRMNIDIFCTAGHKGLYGTTGTGLMLLNGDFAMDTIMEGGTGSASAQLEQPDFLPDRFESGTINTVGILSVGAGLSHIKQIGLEKVYEHEFELCRFCYEQLASIRVVKTYHYYYEKGRYAPIVLFNVGELPSVDVVARLSARGICVRGGLHCAPTTHRVLHTEESGAVRVSPSIFNTKRDMMNLIRELKQIAKYSENA
ncbi:aminotransferase class V-fold PLP-dependent enzyme [Massiliimalia timonensis]|uniref:aminotransferase class V-fold PLP-dependent enzyme n=1 Tax=Massiliimalia timonensis TaxID=1987501 RepID=UPI00189DAFA3|nr:aminotransferase class V-fold PLP-dependent enzyme [Massiliimalia timonensis]